VASQERPRRTCFSGNERILHKFLVRKRKEHSWKRVKRLRVRSASAFLIIHGSLDYEYECNNCSPDITYNISKSNYVSNDDVNNQIRGFLRHNQIRPNAVTLGNADAFIKNDASKCRIQLSKTPYCLLAEANTGPDVAIDYWYDEPSSKLLVLLL